MRKLIWVAKELIKMYSDSPSFFSKKRVESGIAFIFAEGGMIYYLFRHLDMDMTSMLMWAGLQFGIAGYTVSQIEKTKIQENEVK